MTLQNMNDGAHFFAISNDILRSSGIRITTGSNFEQYQEIVQKGRSKQALGAPFRPENHNLDGKNAFWLAAYDEEDTLIHTQAAKLAPLNGATLAGYLMQRFREFSPAIPDVDLGRSRFRATPGLHRIAGKVVYHGDLWVSADSGNLRGTGMASILARYGLMIALERWDPDCIFGFMARGVACKGFAERIGYMHNEPGCLTWYRKEHADPFEGYVCFLTNEETRFLLELPVSELVRRAA